MTTQVQKKQDTQVDIGQETSKFPHIAVITATSMVGVWATACLVGGLTNSGAGAFVKGFISSILGN